jgi:hypothetical protein
MYTIATEVEIAQTLTSNVANDVNMTFVTIEGVNAKIDSINAMLENATDAEKLTVVTLLKEAGVDVVTSAQDKAKQALFILENVANTFEPSDEPYKSMIQIIADGNEITDADLASVNVAKSALELPSANESVAALTKSYQAISKMRNSEFEGIYALEHIPNAYVGLFRGLTTNAKRVLAANAANVTTAQENLSFWSKVNFVSLEKSVIATESAIIQGKSQAEIDAENSKKAKIHFLQGSFIRG